MAAPPGSAIPILLGYRVRLPASSDVSNRRSQTTNAPSGASATTPPVEPGGGAGVVPIGCRPLAAGSGEGSVTCCGGPGVALGLPDGVALGVAEGVAVGDGVALGVGVTVAVGFGGLGGRGGRPGQWSPYRQPVSSSRAEITSAVRETARRRRPRIRASSAAPDIPGNTRA